MDWFLFDRDLHCSRIPTAEANFVKNTKKKPNYNANFSKYYFIKNKYKGLLCTVQK